MNQIYPAPKWVDTWPHTEGRHWDWALPSSSAFPTGESNTEAEADISDEVVELLTFNTYIDLLYSLERPNLRLVLINSNRGGNKDRKFIQQDQNEWVLFYKLTTKLYFQELSRGPNSTRFKILRSEFDEETLPVTAFKKENVLQRFQGEY